MRVVQVGFGAVGKENARQLKMRGHLLAGIVDRQEVLNLIDIPSLGVEGNALVMESDLKACLAKADADIVLLSTSYNPAHIIDVVTVAAAAKCDVIAANGITDIEELEPDLAVTLDRIAREAGIRVLGAGIVPGFFSDMLPLFLTGVSASVSTVRFSFTTDFDKYGPDVMKRFGFGLSSQAFDEEVKSGTMVLFERLWQSAHFIAHQLRWPIVKSEEAKRPLISERHRTSDHASVAPGAVGGFTHRVVIHSTASRTIDIGVTAYLDPAGDQEKPSMAAEIIGDPTFRVDVSGDVLLSSGGLVSTSARMVNSIAGLATVGPGFKAATQLPLVMCRDPQPA